jgi:ribonucleotide monophosphatase NagD (HAD superfamily)|tara:strand:- start:993 stop:1391 length:399 start_codon:yes stop_codon:yes gene_type:complete
MEVIAKKLTYINRTPRDAVMFDIDDTLIRSGDKSPIKDTFKILRLARTFGYKIIIMTARPPEAREYTEEQLRDYGISWDRLYLVPASKKGETKRKTGLRFVLSVGDLDTDCTDSIYKLKLPGPHDSRGYFAG